MALLRKSAAAFMIVSAGLATSSGVAFADEDNDVTSDSAKFIDASDSNNLSGNAILCDLEAVQLLSIEDVAASIPVDLLNKNRDSPDADVTGQSTCSPTSTNESASATDNSAG